MYDKLNNNSVNICAINAGTMRLRGAVHAYLICIRAEGRSSVVAHQYRYVLNMLLEVLGDMDAAAFTPDHLRIYMTEIPINEPKELRVQAAVLRFFVDWLRAQSQDVRPLGTNLRPRSKPGRLSLMPRCAAVRQKLPLAL